MSEKNERLVIPNENSWSISGVEMLLTFDFELDTDEGVDEVVEESSDIVVCVEALSTEGRREGRRRGPFSLCFTECRGDTEEKCTCPITVKKMATPKARMLLVKSVPMYKPRLM